jgi:hypothetical protein
MDGAPIVDLVVQFPTTAAWLIVLLIALGIATISLVIRWAMRLVVVHLSKQDDTMDAIRTEYHANTKVVTDLLHSHDKRINTLEEWRRHADLKLWGHRHDDQMANGESE